MIAQYMRAIFVGWLLVILFSSLLWRMPSLCHFHLVFHIATYWVMCFRKYPQWTTTIAIVVFAYVCEVIVGAHHGELILGAVIAAAIVSASAPNLLSSSWKRRLVSLALHGILFEMIAFVVALLAGTSFPVAPTSLFVSVVMTALPGFVLFALFNRLNFTREDRVSVRP